MRKEITADQRSHTLIYLLINFQINLAIEFSSLHILKV